MDHEKPTKRARDSYKNVHLSFIHKKKNLRRDSTRKKLVAQILFSRKSNAIAKRLLRRPAIERDPISRFQFIFSFFHGERVARTRAAEKCGTDVHVCNSSGEHDARVTDKLDFVSCVLHLFPAAVFFANLSRDSLRRFIIYFAYSERFKRSPRCTTFEKLSFIRTYFWGLLIARTSIVDPTQL